MAKVLVGKTAMLYLDTDAGGGGVGAAQMVLGTTGWTVNTTGDVHDATAMNNTGVRAFEATNTGWTFSALGHWDETETVEYGAASSAAVIVAGKRIEVVAALETNLSSSSAHVADQNFAGDIIVTAFNVNADLEGGVSWAIEGQGCGTLTLPAGAA